VTPYFDLHTDALTHLDDAAFEKGSEQAQWGLHPFLEAGGRFQAFAVYTPPDYDGSDALRYALRFVERLHRAIERGLPMKLIRTASDLQNVPEGVCGAILSLEGATPLGRNPETLRLFYRLGLRTVGFTWNHRNAFADGVGVGDSAGGLTDLGRDLLALCEDLGVAVDLSHLHPRGVDDVLGRAKKPPLASHANAQALKMTATPRARNLSDEFLREIGARGGVVGVTFVPDFLHEPTVEAIAEHAEHVSRIVGEDGLAVGSDFCGCTNPPIPKVSEIGKLWDAMKNRGWTAHKVNKMSRENALAYFRRILPST
jgi:membrane dipeptidase